MNKKIMKEKVNKQSGNFEYHELSIEPIDDNDPTKYARVMLDGKQLNRAFSVTYEISAGAISTATIGMYVENKFHAFVSRVNANYEDFNNAIDFIKSALWYDEAARRNAKARFLKILKNHVVAYSDEEYDKIADGIIDDLIGITKNE